MSKNANDDHYLESGWSLTTPADDTVMRQIVQAMGGDIVSLGHAADARTIVTDDFAASDVGIDGAFSNFAVLLRPLLPDRATDVIGQIDAFYDVERAHGFAGVFSVWPSPEFGKAGWVLGGHPPAHYLPAGRHAPEDPQNVVIRPASSHADLHAIIDCANAAYGTSADPAALVSQHSLEDHRRRYWLAESEGRVAGGSSSWLGDQLTYVTLVATHPDFRRRGIGRAVTWRASLAQPTLPAALISTDEGRLLYDEMGFLRLLRLTLWYRHR
ncbi:MAG: GNAT family N-acetyltransferase, partial [Thermomicrobiales bacterium]